MKKTAAFLALAGALFAPATAFAHAGHGTGLAEGFLHPFTGIDHLVALLALGLLASQLVARRSVTAVALFLAAFVLAFAAARHGITLPAQEAMLAASLIGLGGLIFFSASLPFGIAAAAAILFAAYHGSAHGAELASHGVLPALSGFLLASILLTGAGYLLGRVMSSPAAGKALGYRMAAASLSSIIGLLLLAGV